MFLSSPVGARGVVRVDRRDPDKLLQKSADVLVHAASITRTGRIGKTPNQASHGRMPVTPASGVSRPLTRCRTAGMLPSMIHVVCGVIGDGAGRLLACLRPQGRTLAGLWEFPGGKLEQGESPAAALRRELAEELCIEVEVGAPLRPVIWHYDFASIELLPFHCRILAGTPHPAEHDEIRWCTREEMEHLQWAPADLPILAELRASPDSASRNPVHPKP